MKMRRCERRCEDEKMFYRPPLLEEPCAQTLSGKTPRKSRRSPHIGSNIARLQPGSRKVQARLPTSQPGTLSKARINVNRKTKSTPALVPSKMFQPEAPATGFQRGSSKVSPCSSKGSPTSNDFPARFQRGSS